MNLQSLVFPVLIIVAFYFLLIRPQQQQAKKQQAIVDSLKPGKRIVTIGGIYATVVSIADDRVRVAVVDGSELEISRRAVASVLPDEDDDTDVDEDENEPSVDPELAHSGTDIEPGVQDAPTSTESDEPESDPTDD